MGVVTQAKRGLVMMIEGRRTRRGFIAAASITAVGSIAFARSMILIDAGDDAGMVSFVERRDATPLLDETTTDAWTAAVDSLVHINGEHGMATGRILSVASAPMGGERPAGLREQALIVTFETDPAYAPDGDKTYVIQTAVAGVRELFLTRGETVYGRAILLAVLN